MTSLEKNQLLAPLFLKTGKELEVCGNFVSMPLLSFADAKHLNPSLLVGLLRGEGSLSLSCLLEKPTWYSVQGKGCNPINVNVLM